MGRESIMKFVMEKLKELLLLLENFRGFLVEEVEKVFPAGSREEKMRQWIQVAESMMKEKVKELLVLLEKFRGFLLEELEKVFPAGSREEKMRQWIQVGGSMMKEKVKELLVLLENFRGFLLEELEKVFPADSREEKVRLWIQAVAPFLILGLALFLLYSCLRWCCGRRRGVVKTMKAPGRGGDHRISRADFQSDPKGYFRALHAAGRR